MKAINENLLTCGDVRSYVYARSCVYWGGRWKSGEKRERKWGGSEEDGVIVGRIGVNRAMRVEEGGKERENPNWKSLHAVQKGESGGRNAKYSSKKCPKSAPERGKTRKSGLRRAKNERDLSKNRPESGSKRGKSGKTEILERKRWGGGAAKKWALLPILQCYEVAKWAQMKFSRIFFRRSLAGNAEMLYLCTRNREATLLQERVTL